MSEKLNENLITYTRDHIVSIEELVGRKTGEIVICKAAGAEWDFGRPTLANDEYFESLCRTVPS